jgi:hypothetical protein
VFNPFLLCTLASIFPAIYALRSVNRKGDERFTRHIARDKGWIMALAIIAIVLDGIMAILFIIAVAFISTHSKF